ncbi:unnamed protein product, partial [Mesorhabditis belari]|uniref:GPN-loop GTPase n=1 Tax=Mesorhabditis belari TaxID=2138241 RepID=A0AAF3F885_9BILA
MEATCSTSTNMETETPTSGPDASLPPAVIVLGMAGSGKTSFVQRLTSHLHAKGTPPYVVNLDPAVHKLPYPANIDIRDTVKYKDVMREYGLGPNGAIMTSLNLLCTRFDKVLSLVRQRAPQYSMCLMDTPGQIEAFTWSASGSIITDSLASQQPTVIVYIVDSARVANPTTFMSNMLYACSILYRNKLPFIIVFNKADIVKPTFAMKWMQDFEEFLAALDESGSSYTSDLSRSFALVLDSFYANLRSVAVSSMTGEGMVDVEKAIEASIEEYKKDYLPIYEKTMANKKQIDATEMQKKIEALKKEPVLLSMSGDVVENLPIEKMQIEETK